MRAFVPLVAPIVIPREVPVVVLPPPPVIDVEWERQTAFTEGHAAGVASCAARIAELEARIQAAGHVGSAIASARPAAVRAAADNIAALVVEVARRVVGDALALNPSAMASVVREAVERLPGEDEVWIHVPEASVEVVRAVVKPDWRERVVAEPGSVGCRVECRHASIEVTLETAMAGIEAATRSWLESMG